MTFLVPPLTRDTTGPAALRTSTSERRAAGGAEGPLRGADLPLPRGSAADELAPGRRRARLPRPAVVVAGGGERLGAVIWIPGFLQVDPPSRLVPYVTRWGLDPLFSGGTLPGAKPVLLAVPASTPPRVRPSRSTSCPGRR